MRAEQHPPTSQLPFCRDCDEPTSTLHNRPGESERIICGACQGKANRKIVDRMRACVVALKSGDIEKERQGYLELISLCGRDDTDATVKAIADARSASNSSHKERR